MDLNLTAAAVLFPAISLLLLAYTNRFLALAALIRGLHDRHRAQPSRIIVAQIGNLRYRVRLIRNMQALGVLSLLLCVLCMLVLFTGYAALAKAMFIISLLLMAASLAISIREIQVSGDALNLQLQDLEEEEEAAERDHE
jgi:TRAP-type uncharacterized transport system fused permease subunit